MAKMTKEQTKKFNELFKTTITWGEGEICNGLFEEFGKLNQFLSTCIEGDSMEILEFDGSYYSLVGHIPLRSLSKAKTMLKKAVMHLADGGEFDTLDIDL